MNRLHIGFKKTITLPKTDFLLIDDEIKERKYARVFDPTKDCFNPLIGMDYRRASEFVDIIDAAFSRGESTLTKDTGLDFIAEALVEGKAKTLGRLIPNPDKKASTGHIWAYGKMQRIMRSPVLKRMLTDAKQFSFNPQSVILARVNREELGEFDALLIGLLLMAQFKGQVVVPDFGFYGRDIHAGLIRQKRLIAGVNYLSELPEKLRKAALLIPDKIPEGALFDDGETLAKLRGLRPDHLREDNDYNQFVAGAVG